MQQIESGKTKNISYSNCELRSLLEYCETKKEVPELTDTTFFIVAMKWINFQKTQIKYSSLVKYLNSLKTYILPCFGEREIVSIKRMEILDFSQRLLESGGTKGKGLSGCTVNSILSVIKSIFTFAKNECHLAIEEISSVYVKQIQKPLSILSLKDQNKLTAYLIEHLSEKNLGLLIALYTGMRLGELCALKWEDISFSDKTIFVRHSVQRIQSNQPEGKKTTLLMMPPKSHSSIRQIPIPDELLNLLNSHQKNAACFVLSGTEESIEPRTMEYHFTKILRSIDILQLNFHALRHTFATRCVELGFDIKSLSEILGHANINITLNRYVHPSMALKQKNMNKLSALVSREFCAIS